jgi:predicted permease
MSLTITVLQQVAIMVLIMLVGMVCYKTKVISHQGSKELSDLLLLIVNPILVFLSYQQEFDFKLLTGLLVAMVMTAVALTLMILLSQVLIRKKGNSEYAIERLSAAYGNCGFMGIPIVNGVFGSEGVFYLTAVITVFNVFMWTHGIIMMKGNQGERISLKEIMKNVANPVVIAAFVGLILFITEIRLPSLLTDGLGYVSAMNTPLAMLIAGITLAQADFKKVLSNIRIYYISFLKLLLYPVVLLVLFEWLPFEDVLIVSVLLALSCPTAATGTAFALKFNRNSVYASELFAITTLFSAVSLPLLMVFHSLFAQFFG